MLTDERRKQLMTDLGMPNSQSLYSALQQVANEVEQATRAEVMAEVCSAQNSEYAPQDCLSLTDATQVRMEAQEPVRIHSNGDRQFTMESRQFSYEGNGFIGDNNFDFDAGFNVSGDFLSGERDRYSRMIVDALNTATQPPAPCPKCAELESIIAEEMPATYVVYAMRDALQAKVAEQSAEIERLRAMLPTPASQLGCTSLSDWRFAAMYFESQWKACSHDFNAVAGARDVIIAQQAGRIAELEAKEFDWAKANAKCTDAIAKQAALIEKCERALAAVESLIDESNGVTGLHLNGDVALWTELREGGNNEGWLIEFDEALAAIATQKGGAK